MDVPRDATNVILTVKLVDDNGDLVQGVAFNDADLDVTVKAYNAAESAVTLVSGTVGTFLANSWVETSRGGFYQFCPANDSIVSGRQTLFFFDYSTNQSVIGIVNAIGGGDATLANQEAIIAALQGPTGVQY